MPQPLKYPLGIQTFSEIREEGYVYVDKTAIIKEFLNYWFATGTPTFLLNLLQSRQYDLKKLTEFEIGEEAFEATEPEDMSVQSVFCANRLFDDKRLSQCAVHAGFSQL